MDRRSRHYRGTWYRRGSARLYPRDITLPWARYERYAYTFWRIRIPLWLAGTVAGWVVAGPAGLVGGLATVYAIEGVFSYRRVTISGSAPRPSKANPTDAEVAASGGPVRARLDVGARRLGRAAAGQ